MAIAPIVTEGDWVDVGLRNGIVQKLYPPESPHNFWFLFLDKGKPSRHPVYWDGTKWELADLPGYLGSYASDSEPFVWQLKKGRK